MHISRIAFSLLPPGLVILAVGGLCAPKSLEASFLQVTRDDFSVASDPDVQVFVREVRRAGQLEAAKVPILLLHGARVPGMEDSFYLATGRQLWDASLIRVPTLIVRSGKISGPVRKTSRSSWSIWSMPQLLRP